jgi:isoquinoline 1-oxidoreductase beta subunit
MGLSRRGFIITGLAAGGGLALVYGARRLDDGDATARFASSSPGSAGLNAWIKIAPDSTVTFAVHRAEMGQGVTTSLPMILAEEMDADWSRVKYEFALVDRDYFNFGMVRHGRPFGEIEGRYWAGVKTSLMRRMFHISGVSMTLSSTSIIDAHDSLRPAGAAARAMLVAAAARRWDTDADGLETERSRVVNPATGLSLSYGELAEAAARERPPARPLLKAPQNYRIVGTNVQRLDVPAKVDGTAKFGIDTVLPDMLHAAIRHSPAFGSEIGSINAEGALAQAGIEAVVPVDKQSVAVIAQNTWQAMQAARRLTMTYVAGERPLENTADLPQRFREAFDSPEPSVFADFGDAPAAFENSATQLEAVYDVPYLAHMCMEPMNCTALVADDEVTVWAPTQAHTMARRVAAETAGVQPEQVTVYTTFMGGGLGRRAEMDFVTQAVSAAKAVPGRPVKLTWSREEDVQHDMYRPLAVARMRGGLDEFGNLSAIDGTLVMQSVIASYHQRTPTPRGGDAAQDRGSASGLANLLYAVPNLRIAYVPWTSDIPVGYWRSTGNSSNNFFVESFIDELAHAAAADPLEEPPGVCFGLCGFVVSPQGNRLANSVVTVFPSRTPPAARASATQAASDAGRLPL